MVEAFWSLWQPAHSISIDHLTLALALEDALPYALEELDACGEQPTTAKQMTAEMAIAAQRRFC